MYYRRPSGIFLELHNYDSEEETIMSNVAGINII